MLLQWANDVPQTKVFRAGSSIPGPRFYEPAGKRFQVLQADSPTSRTISCVLACAVALVCKFDGLRFYQPAGKRSQVLQADSATSGTIWPVSELTWTCALLERVLVLHLACQLHMLDDIGTNTGRLSSPCHA